MLEALQFPAWSPSGWSKWIAQLQEAYARRIAYYLHQKPADYEDSEDAANALEKALEAIYSAKNGPRRSASAKESTDDFIRNYLAAREAGEIPGKSTGIFQLDAASGGMRGGELWVIGGGTSRGKSVLMLQIASGVIRNGGRVPIFSLEMKKSQVTGRLATVTGRLNHDHVTKPREVTAKRDLDRIKATIEELAELNFRIDDSDGQTLDHIAAECGMIRDTEGPLDLIVVDYIQLVEGDRRRGESREQEVARISRGLKQLAKKFDCPVISGTQLNDDGFVRESRAISHDADSLLIIVEDGIKIVKLRDGKRDSVLPLFLDGQHQRFVER